MVEAKNKENEKEINQLKFSIAKLYKSFRERFNISLNLYDELEVEFL